MTIFDDAFDYVVGNEGAYSNDKADHGGETFFGISLAARRDHRCPVHPSGVPYFEFADPVAGREMAKHICRLDYWKFDGIRERRLAKKLLDIVFNVGDPIRLIQRAVGVTADGVYGEKTEAAILRLPTEEAIETLSLAVGDKYVDIARNDAIKKLRAHGVDDDEIEKLQLAFLKGWIRRAIRRPPVIANGS